MRNALVRIAIVSLLFFSTLYLLLCFYLIWNETDMVYPAAVDSYGRSILVEPRPQLEDVQYSTDDGVKLTGRLLKRAGSLRSVIYFHGNGERAKWLDDWAIRLADRLGANVLVAEYRGFDDSIWQPTEAGVITDGMAACDFMCQRFGLQPEEVTYYGRSMGGAVAVAVAAERQGKLLILDRTFDRLVDVSAERFWFIPVRFLMQNRFDSVSCIQSYRGPVIQIHGTSDTLIPIKHGKILFAHVEGRSRWIEVPGMGHNDPLPAPVLQEISQAAAALSE